MARPCHTEPRLLSVLLALTAIRPLRGAGDIPAIKATSEISVLYIDPVVRHFGRLRSSATWTSKSSTSRPVKELYCVVMESDPQTGVTSVPPNVKALAKALTGREQGIQDFLTKGSVSQAQRANRSGNKSASTMTKVLRTSINCGRLPRERCTGACEWQDKSPMSDSGSCDINALAALLFMGSPLVKAESERAGCLNRSKKHCAELDTCHWDNFAQQCALRDGPNKPVDAVDCAQWDDGQSEEACRAASTAASAVARQDVVCQDLLEAACRESSDCDWNAAESETWDFAKMQSDEIQYKCSVSPLFAVSSLSYAGGSDDGSDKGKSRDASRWTTFNNLLMSSCKNLGQEKCIGDCEWDDDRHVCDVSPTAAMASMGAIIQKSSVHTSAPDTSFTTEKTKMTTLVPTPTRGAEATVTVSTTPWAGGKLPPGVSFSTVPPMAASSKQGSEHETTTPAGRGDVIAKLKAKGKQCRAIELLTTCLAFKDCTWKASEDVCEISGVFAMTELSRGGSQRYNAKAELLNLAKNGPVAASNITRKEFEELSLTCHLVLQASDCHWGQNCAWDEKKDICDASPLWALHAVLGDKSAAPRRLRGHKKLKQVNHKKVVSSVAISSNNNMSGTVLLEKCRPFTLIQMRTPKPCLGSTGEAVFWLTSIKPGNSYVAFCEDGGGVKVNISFIARDKETASLKGNSSKAHGSHHGHTGATFVHNRSHHGLNSTATESDDHGNVLPVSLVAFAVLLVAALAFLKNCLPCMGSQQVRTVGGSTWADHEMLNPTGGQANPTGGLRDGFAESQSLRWSQLQGGPE